LLLQEVEAQESLSAIQAKTMTDKERSDAIKRQVEYYFSRQNLLQDTFLLSKMDKDHFVDISVIAEFKMMKQLTSDIDTILASVKDSEKVIIDEGKKRIKPVPNNERTTLILRNIPTSASEESVKNLLQTVDIPPILSIRADVGDNWFLSFETQDLTKTAMERVKSLKWEDKQIGCAIKSESFLKGLALMPANAYQSGAPFVVSGDTQGGYRSTGRRVGNVTGRRNVYPNASAENHESNGRKNSVGKKGKGKNGPRDGAVKDTGTNGARSPPILVNAVQASLKPSDFPLLGSNVVEVPVAEAKSAASTPPLCTTPNNDAGTSTPDQMSAAKAKVSYAQMALASVSSVASNVAVKV